MMAPWQTLGVEPDANKKDIKRAYASLAKQFRPDESPGDFQRIREAYEAMLALLQHSQSSGQQPQSQDSVERQNIVNLPGELAEPTSINTEASESTDTTAKDIDNFINRFEQLIRQFPANGKLSAVELNRCHVDTLALIHDEILSHWWARDFLSNAVFDVLCQNIAISSGFLSTSTNMPNQFLHYLDRHFLWTENESSLREMHNNEGAGLVFFCIHDATMKNLPHWDSVTPKANDQNANRETTAKTLGQRMRNLLSGQPLSND